jgi:predicted nucleic acid-binding protein
MGVEGRVVVDSSVFAAILLKEPGHEANAQALSVVRGVYSVPFFRFEVANALWKQKKWSETDLDAALETLWKIPVSQRFEMADAQVAMQLARTHNHPYYDTAFIALAQNLNLPLWTLDKRQASLAATCDVTVVAL